MGPPTSRNCATNEETNYVQAYTQYVQLFFISMLFSLLLIERKSIRGLDRYPTTHTHTHTQTRCFKVRPSNRSSDKPFNREKGISKLEFLLNVHSIKSVTNILPRKGPEVIKHFSCSVESEICSANKN